MRAMLTVAAAALAAAGCSPDGPQKEPVRGRVTYKGAPVAQGMIRFSPAGAPSVMGPITDGRYSLDKDGGVPVGPSKVSIEAFEPTGKQVITGPGGRTEPEMRQALPKKYNAASTLTADVTAGQPNDKDFDLAP